jgi:hypothetical protein
MENLIGLFIGVMVSIIVLFNVTLPTINTALYGSGAGAANVSASNLTLSGVIPTLLITCVVVYVVRGMLGGI